MARASAFNSPLMLGFEHFERILDRVSKAGAEGYPPYDIEQVDTNGLRITLAVAGFTTDDLSVRVEENQLIIGGKQHDDASRSYVYRGIAARQFQRCFILAEGIAGAGASLDNGLLSVDLIRPEPARRARTIEIKGAAAARDADGQAGGLVEVTTD